MEGTNLIKRFIRWLRNTDHLERLGDYIEKLHEEKTELCDKIQHLHLDKDDLERALDATALDLCRVHFDLLIAKEALYAIATSPHVNNREDMIELAYETYAGLSHD